MFLANYNAYQSGTEAFNAFQADASLSAKHMAVSGSVSVGASISKLFSKNYSYAFFNYNTNLINVFISDWADYIAEETLEKRVLQLGKFNVNKPDLAIVAKWRSFFKAMGTHIIIGCAYGARFQLVSG